MAAKRGFRAFRLSAHDGVMYAHTFKVEVCTFDEIFEQVLMMIKSSGTQQFELAVFNDAKAFMSHLDKFFSTMSEREINEVIGNIEIG